MVISHLLFVVIRRERNEGNPFSPTVFYYNTTRYNTTQHKSHHIEVPLFARRLPVVRLSQQRCMHPHSVQPRASYLRSQMPLNLRPFLASPLLAELIESLDKQSRCVVYQIRHGSMERCQAAIQRGPARGVSNITCLMCSDGGF